MNGGDQIVRSFPFRIIYPYVWSLNCAIFFDKELQPQWQVFPIQCRRYSCCNPEPEIVQPFLTDVSVVEFRRITKKSVEEIEICGFGDFVFVEPAGVLEYACGIRNWQCVMRS
jgi:hypothetical protein